MKTVRSPLRRSAAPRTRGSRGVPLLLVMALLATIFLVAQPRGAAASSNFETGTLNQANPITGPSESLGVCRLFIGPRDFIKDGEFLLEIGDVENGDGDVQELVGTATPDGNGSYVLSADEQEAEDFYQQVLRDQLHRPDSAFNLVGLDVQVFKTELDRGPQDISCEMRLHGFLSGPGTLALTPIVPRTRLATIGIGSTVGAVDAVYAGAGLVFPGIGQQPATAAVSDVPAKTEDVSCPRPNFAPVPEQCNDPSCLVTFAGYQWWTEYEYWGPNGGYFYNNYNAWSPKNVTVDDEGLHLFVQVQNVGGGNQYTAAEAVTALNLDGSLAKLGYGTYLVTSKIKTASSWDTMDPNVAFGAFVYERDATGDTNNPGREIDLAEVSRWGRVNGQPCQNIPILCTGNSQFTLQQWNKLPANVNRYTINSGVQIVTLVMEWPGANQPVTFKQYDGDFSLDNLPASPSYTWTTAADQNKFIPVSNCEQFHLNFWMGNNPAQKDRYNPPPASPQELVVTRFQFKAL